MEELRKKWCKIRMILLSIRVGIELIYASYLHCLKGKQYGMLWSVFGTKWVSSWVCVHVCLTKTLYRCRFALTPFRTPFIVTQMLKIYRFHQFVGDLVFMSVCVIFAMTFIALMSLFHNQNKWSLSVTNQDSMKWIRIFLMQK